MRSPHTLLLPLALAAATLLPVSDAFAQQAASPLPASAAPVSVSPPPVPPPETAALAIVAPPGARLRFEMDARSEDLLGLVKSFLKGIGETKGTAAARANAAPPAGPVPPVNPIEEALENGNLADILKDVNHLHFVVWELPPPPSAPTPSTAAKPLTKVAASAAPPPTPSPAFDTNAFYEGAFQAEGAHRVLYTDADEFKLVMVGFPDHHGYAFVASDLPASGGGYIAAARADGYPNMEALTAFISHVTSAVMKTKTGKQMIDATLNTVKGAGANDKSAGADDKSAGTDDKSAGTDDKGTDKK